MGVLNQHGQGSRGGKVTPEVFPVATLASGRALPNQPAHMPRALAIDPPAAQGQKLGALPALRPLAPGNRVPGVARLLRQHGIRAPDRAGLAPAERHAEIGPHRDHMPFPPLLQAVKELRIIAVIGIAGDTRVRYAPRPGLVQQRQGDLGFGLKYHLLRHVRLLAPLRILGPLTRQIQPRRHRPRQRALGIMTIHRDLTVGHLARRPRILPRDPHRVAAPLFEAGIIEDEHPIAFAAQRLHLGDPLPIEVRLIPDHVGHQVLQLLLIGVGDDVGQGVTVLVRMLTEQPGHILTQGLGAGRLGKMDPQRRQKLRQLGQGCPRGVGEPLEWLRLLLHAPSVAQIS